MGAETKIDSVVCAYMIKNGDLDTVINTVRKEKGHLVGERNYGLFKNGSIEFRGKTISIYKFAGKSDHGIHLLLVKDDRYCILDCSEIEEDLKVFFECVTSEFNQLSSFDKTKLLKEFLKYY